MLNTNALMKNRGKEWILGTGDECSCVLQLVVYISLVYPIIMIIIHSKYFPDSDWLKVHV